MAIDDETPTVTEPEPVWLPTVEGRLQHLEALVREILELLKREAGSGRLGHD